VKTAVSIPDPVYVSAEKLAKRLGASRSKLYAAAPTSYLQKQNDGEITRKLDEVYESEDNSGDNAIDPVLWEMQLQSLSYDAEY
jgi:hypothetical protein